MDRSGMELTPRNGNNENNNNNNNSNNTNNNNNSNNTNNNNSSVAHIIDDTICFCNDHCRRWNISIATPRPAPQAVTQAAARSAASSAARAVAGGGYGDMPIAMPMVINNSVNGMAAPVGGGGGDSHIPTHPEMTLLRPIVVYDNNPGPLAVQGDYFTPELNEPVNVTRYSRKVFVGGLPSDIHVDAIVSSFRRYGTLTVDWPHKTERKMAYPPQGYGFLVYKDAHSVNKLIDGCGTHEGNYYWSISSPSVNHKAVQIRPWRISDAEYVANSNTPINKRLSIFVGGLPRMLRAYELAIIAGRKFGGVCAATIEMDRKTMYPKGVGCVSFNNFQSYVNAIIARRLHIKYADIDKYVEVMPYLLEDQKCDLCQTSLGPYFCGAFNCLQYYCHLCWAYTHSQHGRQTHVPLMRRQTPAPIPSATN